MNEKHLRDSMNPKKIQRKIKSILLPIGYPVKIITHYDPIKNHYCNEYEVLGIINKCMYPGYKYLNTDETVLRFGITNSCDSNLMYVVEEYDIIDPDLRKASLDNEYRVKLISDIKKFLINH